MSPAHDPLSAGIIGRSAAIVKLTRTIAKVAASHANVLIEGESGTGKELVARAIHMTSSRADGVFLGENCAALSETLIESELFGHVRGAFTGAERDRRGLFALADGGTLFLDEVGDMSARIQAKLLRVLQEGEFRPLGGRDIIRTDLRIISATNRDLKALVEAAEFRGDLYYRLNVVGIRLTPLRERRDDIAPLVEHFLSRLRVSAPRGISKEALEMLTRYPWPGNVRELQNVIERAAVMAAGDVIGVDALPDGVIDFALAERSGPYPDEAAKPQEMVMIEKALIRFRGDKSKAARAIGWNRPKLYRRMDRFSIPRNFGRV
ncbi:MAG TPA: sigma-54 dependent transcriptional regulator [Patescibacteria group bacterium]|nr:sigma-54 dependent transcriptional regulator [Patescibacteria group bacterium]